MRIAASRIWARYSPRADTYAAACLRCCSVVDRKRILRTSPFGHSRNFRFTEFSEVPYCNYLLCFWIVLAVVYGSKRGSKRSASVSGARRLSQQSFFPEPRIQRHVSVYTRAFLRWAIFGTLRRVRTPRQPYSPKYVEGEFYEVPL